jgi:hypothetical protein
VDPLLAAEREAAAKLTPSEKLVQALELMAAGIRLKRSSFRRRFPTASEEEIDRLVVEWLGEDD